MESKANGAHFWTAVFGLVAAIFTLLAAIGGTAGFFQGEEPTPAPQTSVPAAATAAATPAATRAPTPSPLPQTTRATPTPTPVIIKTGTLDVPVNEGDINEAADIDSGKVIRIEKSEEARLADLIIMDDDDGLSLKSGVLGEEGGYGARFITVSDEAAGRALCVKAAGLGGAVTSLQFPSDIEVGSHVCLVTTEEHVAEFEIVAAKLNGRQRYVEIRYTTWAD